MRTLHPTTLENRKRKLLQAVVYHYVRTAKPVGSQAIVDKYKLGLSSATIRNLLVELEKEGYIHQPHTSAGRVPTDKGYRFYVDSLVEIQSLAGGEEEKIRKEYTARTKELEDLMISTSHLLSKLSHYTGVVLSPPLDKERLRHLQMIPLGESQVLIVIVSQTGLIRHKVISLSRPIQPIRLSEISLELNRRLEGKPISNVRLQILDHIEAIEQEHEEAIEAFKELAREAFDLRNESQLYVDGRENLTAFPEFEDYNQLSGLLRVVEHKDLLIAELERAMKKDGLSVKIGTENSRPEMRGLSLVSSTYKMGDNTLGVLGIIGPRRMEYGRMMAVVEGITKIVNQMLGKIQEP